MANQYCIRIGCSERGRATESERCPACGHPTSADAPVQMGLAEEVWLPTRFPLPVSSMVTLPEVPGRRIVKVLGVVTELSSASGWTASAKGNQALNKALEGLAWTAASLGANAVVGLSAATFGAHGGITAGFGGDAVGVLLMGTAVVVESPDV